MIKKYNFLLVVGLACATPTIFCVEKSVLVDLKYYVIPTGRKLYKINENGTHRDIHSDLPEITCYDARIRTNLQNETVLSFDAPIDNGKQTEKRSITIVTPPVELGHSLKFNISQRPHKPIACIDRSVEPTILNGLVDLKGTIYFNIIEFTRDCHEKKPPVGWFNNVNTIKPLLYAGLVMIVGLLIKKYV